MLLSCRFFPVYVAMLQYYRVCHAATRYRGMACLLYTSFLCFFAYLARRVQEVSLAEIIQVRCRCKPGGERHFCKREVRICQIAVSYTHLAVYKRQGIW